MLNILRLNPFPAVSANAVSALATSQLAGMSVHAIIFEQGGTAFTKANITRIRIGAGGKNFVNDIAADQLQTLNSYDGHANPTNYVIHYFGDPTARTIRGQHLGDLDLSVHAGPLEIEATIGGATAPTLQCYAVVGAPKLQMGLGYSQADAATVRALIRTVISESAAVSRKAEGVGLGSHAGARLRKLAMLHTNLTKAEFRKQGVVQFEDCTIALTSAVENDFGRVSQAGLFVIDRIMDGNQSEAEDTVDSKGNAFNMQLLVTTSAADTISAYADVHTMPQLL